MLGITLALLTWAHAACPDLAGRYLCTFKVGAHATQDLLVTQSTVDEIATYRVNDSVMKSDNVERSIVDGPEMKRTRLRVWCDESGKLKGRLWANYFESGNYAGDLELRFSYAKVGRDIRQVSEGRLLAADETTPLSSDVMCKNLD